MDVSAETVAMYCTVIGTVVSVMTLLTGLRRFERDQLQHQSERDDRRRAEAEKQAKETVRHRTEVLSRIDGIGDTMASMRAEINELRGEVKDTQAGLADLERRHDRDMREGLTILLNQGATPPQKEGI